MTEVNITILFFAKAREIVGKSEAILRVSKNVSCNHLLDEIVEEFQLQSIKNNVILAYNQEFCDLSAVLELKEGDEIAVVPPLSGG